MTLAVNLKLTQAIYAARAMFGYAIALAAAMAIATVGVWRFGYIFTHTHHGLYHGSFLLGVMGLMGAMLLVVIGTVWAAIMIRLTYQRLERLGLLTGWKIVNAVAFSLILAGIVTYYDIAFYNYLTR